MTWRTVQEGRTVVDDKGRVTFDPDLPLGNPEALSAYVAEHGRVPGTHRVVMLPEHRYRLEERLSCG